MGQTGPIRSLLFAISDSDVQGEVTLTIEQPQVGDCPEDLDCDTLRDKDENVKLYRKMTVIVLTPT